jgi:hypothetical protein
MGSKPKGISGSRIPKILGLSNFGTPLDVWLEIMEERELGFCKKNGYELKPFSGNSATRIGLLFEPLINNRLEKKYNCKVESKEKEYQKGVLTCHLDGIILNGAMPNENKTTSSFVFRKKFGKQDTDEIPAEYLAQCQLQMYLSDYSMEYMHTLVFPDDQETLENYINEKKLTKRNLKQWVSSLDEMGFLQRFIIQSNSHLVSVIKNTADLWERKYIKEKTPPDPKDISDYRKIFRDPNGECVVDKDIKHKLNILHRIKAQSDNVEKYGKRVKNEILDYMMKNKTDSKTDKCFLLDTNGYNLATWNGKTLYLKHKKTEDK